MDREEQRLRDELERMAPEPDEDGVLDTVVRKGRALRRRRRIARAGTAVVAVALLGAIAFGAVELVDSLRSEPVAGGWSDMDPAAGGETTVGALETTTTVEGSGTTGATSPPTTGSTKPTSGVTTYPAPPVGYIALYTNTEYGFSFWLPENWKGLSIVTDQWQGQMLDTGEAVTGPEILIRHPLWTEAEPRQDIPIMVFTLRQWELITAEKLAVGAAPIPPSELGRNSTYVFALPARYNYAFPTGFEEVEQILQGHPWQPLPRGV